MEFQDWSNGDEIKRQAQQISWDDFFGMGKSDKTIFLNNSRTRNPFHVLFSQQFNRRILDLICQVAEKAREIRKDRRDGRRFLRDLLFDVHALNFFAQPSSRTFLSFGTAQKYLGMDREDIRDPSISSEAKGESWFDSVRTFSAYADLLVLRHFDKDAVEKAAWVLNKSDRRIPVINGGSGPDQHPTQALLDIYTLYRAFGGKIDGKTIAMVGDLARGRTVRSLAYLMKNYEDMQLVFVAPERLKMKVDIKSFLLRHNIPFYETDDLREVIGEVDATYMTRIQDEHDKGGKKDEPAPVDPRFQFKFEYLDLMREHAVILHPLPKRDEIDLRVDDCGDPRVAYWDQERNGVYTRLALIATIFEKEQEILNF